MSDLLSLRYSLRALGGRMGSEWERDRRDTLFLMGAIALAVLPQAPHLPMWIPIAFALMFCWRLTIVFTGRRLPAFWLRVVGAGACLAAVFAEYESLLGREQGVAMLTLFLGLKLLEMKARRDLFIVIFLCFFLLLTTFFQSQSLVTAVLVLGSVSALIATMITMQFGENEASIASRFRQSGLLLLQAAPIAIAMFVLFPRLATPLWGFQGSSSSASTGLSDSMSPGNVASLSKSSSVVLRAAFKEAPPPNHLLYWRGPVFGDFDGRTWKAVDFQKGRSVPPEVQIISDDTALNYNVTMEPSQNQWLMALDLVTRIDTLRTGKALITPEFTLELNQPIYERLRYTVRSNLNYRLGVNETTDSLSKWKQLPAGFNPKTRALAQQWRDDRTVSSIDDYVNAALRMFHKQAFVYTLQPPQLGRDSVDDFLFTTRSGFCEHFTSSFVVLMRMLGIPARVVTGYQGGEINPVDGFMVVRQSDAHAWAEYWTQADGWVRVDPTAAVAPERIESDFRLYNDQASLVSDTPVGDAWTLLQFNLEALTNRWNQWVLNFDRSSQKKLLDGFGMDGGNWYGLAGLLAGAMTLLIGASALFTLQPRKPRDPTGDAFEAFCLKMATQGIAREKHETPLQFLRRASKMLDPDKAREARRIVAIYSRLRYGSLSSVYLGEERRATTREKISRAMARRTTMARDGLRTLRRAVKAFAP
ncbi:MAG: DUF3488 and transglutaminase-like domain-containing protein [Burkholderiaceae bacterium]